MNKINGESGNKEPGWYSKNGIQTADNTLVWTTFIIPEAGTYSVKWDQIFPIESTYLINFNELYQTSKE